MGQLLDGAGANVREGRVERSPQLDRKWDGLGLAVRAAGDIEVAVDVERPLARRLVRRRLAHPVVDVVVELVDRHAAVAVAVGFPAFETLHDRRGEDRRLRVSLAAVAFEGVLHRPRGSQDDAPLALELLLDRDALTRAVDHPSRESAAEATVEQQDDAARPALRHLPVDELRRDRSRFQMLDRRVRAREVERAVLVLEPVAGDVE